MDKEKSSDSRPDTETIRKRIIALLEESACTSRDISKAVGISEKEVTEHLAHIQKTLLSEGRKLLVEPSRCRKCGFVFRKRDRLTKPGKCPVCRHQSLSAPVFSITGKESERPRGPEKAI